ncbi:MAG: DUF2905 domain-containing protein [Sporichthyaceae bacterium]|nr:DUF2905 domain-containing protein [Sporichthyaceae bacterium]
MSKGAGPWLIGLGALLVLIGLIAWTGALSWFGKLPGDIRIDKPTTKVFIPITSMIIVSLVASLLLALFRRR